MFRYTMVPPTNESSKFVGDTRIPERVARIYSERSER